MAPGPTPARSVRAILADAVFQMCGVQDAPARHGERSRSDRGSMPPVCGSPSEQVGDLPEIVVIETRGSTSHSRASRAGHPIAGRVGQIISLNASSNIPLRVRLGIESCDAHPVSPAQAVSSRAPGAGDETVRRRRPQPRVSRVRGAFERGVIGASGAASGRVRTSPWSAGHAATWARLSGAAERET
jgi:hypothetical protein